MCSLAVDACSPPYFVKGLSAFWVSTFTRVPTCAAAGKLIAEDGWTGLWRGIAPRCLSAMLWGTMMVSTYEFLKRTCALPAEPSEGRDN